MMTTRRWALARAAAAPVAAAATASACVPGAPGGDQPRGYAGPPVEVVFMRPANQTLARAYVAQAEAFNQKGSQVTGRFEPAPPGEGDWLTKITTMLASDTTPDCFLVQQHILAQLASNGSLLALEPLVARDRREVKPDDFFPSHLEAGKWRGKQVALSPDGCAQLEYYNTTLLREAGAAAPKSTWTWHDYLDTARRLTKTDGGQVTQAGIGTLFTERHLLPWLWSNDADVFDADFTRVRVTEPAAIEAIQFAVDLVNRHGVVDGGPGIDLGPRANLSGKVAMWRAVRGFFGQLADVTSFQVNVVPVARSPRTGRSVTFTTPGHIGIGAANRHSEAAWTWLKFLTSTEAQIIRSEVQGGGCPSRKSATQHPSYKDLTMPALESTAANQAFVDVLTDPKLVRFVPSYVAMDESLEVLTKHVTAAYEGKQSVPSAMRQAQQELEALLRQRPQPRG